MLEKARRIEVDEVVLDLEDGVAPTVLGAARAVGVQAIDGPFVAIDDLPGLRTSALRASDLGFDGKWAIHPSHIPTLIDAFTPTQDEIERARQVLDLLEAGAAHGCGAMRMTGQMVDEAMRGAAVHTFARAGGQ